MINLQTVSAETLGVAAGASTNVAGPGLLIGAILAIGLAGLFIVRAFVRATAPRSDIRSSDVMSRLTPAAPGYAEPEVFAGDVTAPSRATPDSPLGRIQARTRSRVDEHATG